MRISTARYLCPSSVKIDFYSSIVRLALKILITARAHPSQLPCFLGVGISRHKSRPQTGGSKLVMARSGAAPVRSAGN